MGIIGVKELFFKNLAVCTVHIRTVRVLLHLSLTVFT